MSVTDGIFSIGNEPILEYKNDVLNRMGGKQILDFAVIDLCERILKDQMLHKFYNAFDECGLRILQKETILLAIAELPINSSAPSRVALRHYRMVELGLTQRIVSF